MPSPLPLIDRPLPFGGTREEAEANLATHEWGWCGDELVCFGCDSKPWHAGARYPCGSRPPREVYSATWGRALTPEETAAHEEEF